MYALSRTSEPDALLTEAQASQVLNLSVRTLQAWRGRGRGPCFVRAGRAVRYRPSDLSIWIKEQTVSPSGPAGEARGQQRG
jgi:hypothetical protein